MLERDVPFSPSECVREFSQITHSDLFPPSFSHSCPCVTQGDDCMSLLTTPCLVGTKDFICTRKSSFRFLSHNVCLKSMSSFRIFLIIWTLVLEKKSMMPLSSPNPKGL